MSLSIFHVASGKRWISGYPKHVLDLARGQTGLGHRVTISCIRESMIEEAARRAGIATVNTVMSSSQYDFSRLPGFLGCLGQGYDVVHVHYCDDYVIPAIAARMRRIPLVIQTRHHLTPFRNHVTALATARVFYDALIAVSASVRTVLLESGVPEDKIYLVRNGIDPDAHRFDTEARQRVRAELRIPEGSVVVCAVGRLVPEKGFSILVRGFKLAVDRGARVILVLVGRGPEESPLRRLVSDLGLGSTVRFTGYRSDVNSLWSAADIAVVPSFNEPLGYVALEALACSRPVIATRAGGLVEVVTDECGVFVPPGDAEALAVAIERLAADANERARLSSATRDRAMKFSLSKMVADVMGVYQSVSGAKQRRRG